MNKDKLWLMYVEKNPVLLKQSGSIELPVHQFKKFFNLTYDEAFKAGSDKATLNKSLFESIFGGNG